jgi:hypothetical protein
MQLLRAVIQYLAQPVGTSFVTVSGKLFGQKSGIIPNLDTIQSQGALHDPKELRQIRVTIHTRDNRQCVKQSQQKMQQLDA